MPSLFENICYREKCSHSVSQNRIGACPRVCRRKLMTDNRETWYAPRHFGIYPSRKCLVGIEIGTHLSKILFNPLCRNHGPLYSQYSGNDTRKRSRRGSGLRRRGPSVYHSSKNRRNTGDPRRESTYLQGHGAYIVQYSLCHFG